MASLKLTGFWFILHTLHPVTAYPQGAPKVACEMMTPNHPPYSPSTEDFPYDIHLSAHSYCPNNEVNVTLEGAPYGIHFKGFLCQVRTSVNKFETSGTLTNIDAEVETTNNCDVGASLTHKDKAYKKAVHLSWKPDSMKTDSVFIVCTVVQSGSTFWVRQSSTQITYAGADRCTPQGDTKGLPGSCNDDQICDRTVSMSVCDADADVDGECVCPDDMKIAHPTHTFCSPKVLEDECMKDSDCGAIAETFCDSTKTPAICACKSAFTNNRTDGPCFPKVLGDVCSSNDDCRGVPNSMCENRMCKCSPDYEEQMSLTNNNCVPKGSDTCMVDKDCTGADSCMDGKCTSGAVRVACTLTSILLLIGGTVSALGFNVL